MVRIEMDRYRRVLKNRPHDYRALALWVGEMWPFQRRWLLDPARFAVCNKSRKIGLSFTTAGSAVIWGAFHKETTTIISVGQKEANEVLGTAVKLARILRKLGSDMAQIIHKNKVEIVFQSGGRILALPSDGGRSYSGNVFLDEFAHTTHATEVWKAAAPVALLGHKMRVVSTPNGVGNEFHDLWEYTTDAERSNGRVLDHTDKMKWVAHEIPISLATSEGYPVDLEACWSLVRGDPRVFDQEYNCSFLNAEFQYIPTDMIAGCSVDTSIGNEEGVYYAGLDIGREVDLSVLVVIKRWINKDGKARYRVVYVESMKRTEEDALHDMVAAAFARFKIKRLCIDRGGMGTFPADRIKKNHSEKYDPPNRRPRVDPIDFTVKSKDELATGLYTLMSTRALELPATDAALPSERRLRADGSFTMVNEPGIAKHLKREIASLQRKITKSGNVIYETPRTREGHGDRAWALMLATYAIDPVHPMLLALSGGRAQ
jgi:phage FluMu gp28-like protein